MSWTYCNSSGEFFLGGEFVFRGYSGHGDGKDNPAMASVHNVGPIPAGYWKIIGPPYTSPELGPYVLNLEPQPGTVTFGRTEFRIHGDKLGAPQGNASHGCIVLARDYREALWASGDLDLTVVTESPDPSDITPPYVAVFS